MYLDPHNMLMVQEKPSRAGTRLPGASLQGALTSGLFLWLLAITAMQMAF